MSARKILEPASRVHRYFPSEDCLMPGTPAPSATRSRFHYQQQTILKPLALTVQQAAQTFHRSANHQPDLGSDFQFKPQAAYFQANDVQLKRLKGASAPVNAVDLRR